MKTLRLALGFPLAFWFAVSPATAEIRKLGDGVVYRDPAFHAAFPSIVRRPDGELLVAFRRAPDWRLFGAKDYSHTDANSQLVLVRSRDDGATWSAQPELILAHPYGGSQDPCMVQLRDGTIVCASYGWVQIRDDVFKKLPQPLAVHDGGQGRFVAMGGYVLRSTDGGHAWQGPLVPPPVPTEKYYNSFGQLMPALNRGAMCEGRDGRLYWAVAAGSNGAGKPTAEHLMISTDRGLTWTYGAPIASDDKVTFNETSLYETPRGDLIAFMRTEKFEDQACLARSTDGGKTFGPWQGMGFQGHPLHAVRLPDERVLLVYGYRHKPYGIRARILNAECTDAATAREIVLREDGGGVDLGYPWAVVLNPTRALVVYYFNRDDGTRTIESTLLGLD